MPAQMKPLDPNMRQQLAAMLSGDAKAGSVRADLVRGLLGSSVDDKSTGLVGMTPLGAAFDVSAANRDMRQGGSGLGHTLSAAAGMIPGAGPEAHAALEEIVPGVTRALQNIKSLHPEDIHALLDHGFKPGDIGDENGLLFQHPETGETIEINHKGQADHFDEDGTRIASRPSLDSLLQMSEPATQEVARAVQHLVDKYHPADLANDVIDKAMEDGSLSDLATRSGFDPYEAVQDPGALADTMLKKFSPTDLAVMHHDMQAHLGPDPIVELGDHVPDDAETSGVRMQLNPQNSVPVTGVRAQLEAASKDKAPETIVDAKDPPSVAGVKTSISDATKPQPVSAAHIATVSGGDPKKENFIRNAMDDEGGNVPEEVGQTLSDHMSQVDRSQFEQLLKDHNVHHLLDNSEDDGEAIGTLGNILSGQHSIPEMLAMHYDLDPETMGKAYDMPPAAYKIKPTQ